MPVGDAVLGHVFNVHRRAARRRRARARARSRSAGRSTATPPAFDTLEPQGHDVRDRHQGHRPAHPVPAGRQDRPVRRRRRGQDRAHHRDDQPGRLRSTVACRCSPAWASAPVRAPTSSSRWRSRACSRRPRSCFGQMDEPPGVRLRVALSALTMAEYFRDVQGQDVLLFVDNIFRFVQAGSEVSTLLGRMPSAVGYQPTLADEMGELQERITSTRGRSITSLQAVYVPADDYTDPAPFTTFTHFDATTELSPRHRRARHLPGRRPAGVDLDHPRPRGRRRAPLRRGPPGAGDPPALQGAAGHHRHPRPRRALRGGPGHRRPGPQGPAVPVPADVTWPRSSPASPGVTVPVEETVESLRAARQRRPRRPARAGLPQRRRRRRRPGQGRASCEKKPA